MPGPTRQQLPRPPAGGDVADRDATIESLLLTGLDFYFSGHYERAIHAWTRVLFLDRGHVAARAYIDRARRVLAERQRELDEVLHGGLAAFDEGDAEKARELLTSLLQRGSADDVALAVLQRMDRLEAAARAAAPVPLPPTGARGTDAPATGAAASHARVNRALIVAASVFLVGAILLVAGWEQFGAWWQEQRPPRSLESTVAVVEADDLPRPSPSELVLARARALLARGHLHEALRAADAVRLDDARRPEADRLRAEIQRALLAAAGPHAAPATGPAPWPATRP
jgi:cytochrome c-type biogenesis protein CcmH/NrfG